jgi:PAS domain S-box-containing protein
MAANDAAVHASGLTRRALLHGGLAAQVPEPDLGRLKRLAAARDRAGTPFSFGCLGPSRELRLMEAFGQHVTFQRRRAWLLELRDITPHGRAPKAQERAEERLRTVLSHAPLMVFAVDAEGRFTLAEGRALLSLGMTPGLPQKVSVFERFEKHPTLPSEIRRALAGEAFASTVDFPGVILDVTYIPIRNDHGEVSEVLGVATDMTERVQTERALKKQTARYEAVLNAQSDLGEGLAVVELDTQRFVRVNDAVCTISGYTREELLRLNTFFDLVPADQRTDVLERLHRTRSGTAQPDHH